MIETTRHITGDGGLSHYLGPIEKEVVIVEHVLLLLGRRIGGKELPQFSFPSRAPRKRCG
jgi:hypothetical protein